MHDGRFLIDLVSGVPVVVAPEEIDMANVQELQSALRKAAADGPGTLVADLSRTQYCDSSGIHTLLAAHKRAQADGGELRLVVPDGAVLRVFTITGIDRLIPSFTSLDDAHRTRHPTDQTVAGSGRPASTCNPRLGTT